jgi:hypothetical protein
LVAHLKRCLKALDGKAIEVWMSRHICMELHRQIVAFKSEHSVQEAIGRRAACFDRP